MYLGEYWFHGKANNPLRVEGINHDLGKSTKCHIYVMIVILQTQLVKRTGSQYNIRCETSSYQQLFRKDRRRSEAGRMGPDRAESWENRFF